MGPPLRLHHRRSVSQDLRHAGVVPPDHRLRLLSAAGDDGPHIQRLRCLAVGDVYSPVGYDGRRLLHDITGDIGQNGQPSFRFIQQRTQRRRQLQSDAVRAGNAHADAVFVDVGTHQHVDFFRPAFQGMSRHGHRQTHAARIGTAGGGLYLRGQYIQKLLLVNHHRGLLLCRFLSFLGVPCNFSTS